MLKGRLLPAAAGLVLVLAAPASAQAPAGLTLTQAIERALAANPSVAAARLQRAVDAAGVEVARERPNPEIGFEATNEIPRKAVVATVPIELGGKRQARINVATATVAAGEAELARIIAEIRSDVRQVYFEVVAADRRVTFSDEILALTTRARDAAQARVQAGDVPQSDLTQPSLALALAIIDAAAARGDAASTRAELNALLGQPVGTPLTLADDLSTGAILPVADAIGQASRSNAELTAIDRRLEAQVAKVALAKANRTPDVSAGGTLTYDAEPGIPDFTDGAARGRSRCRSSRRIRPPFSSKNRRSRAQGGTRAVVAQSRAPPPRRRRARRRPRQLRGTQSEVLPPLAIEAERQAQVAYSAGQTGLVALVQSLRTAHETRQRGLQAAQDYQRALGDIERAMGIR